MDQHCGKIGLIVPNKYPVPAVKGGAIEELAELLLEMNEKYGRMDLTVFSVWDEEAKKRAGKYKKSKVIYIKNGGAADRITSAKAVRAVNRLFVRHFGKSFLFQNYLKRICRIIQKEMYDLILVEDAEYDLYGRFLKKISKSKACIHVHTQIEGSGALNDWFSRCICISNFVARNLIMSGRVSAGKVDVLHNGIDLDRFLRVMDARSLEKEKKARGIKDEIVFAYWGRLIPEKGVRELLLAFRKVAAKLHAKLLIIGSPAFGMSVTTKYGQELKELSESLGEKVCFTGFVPNEDLWKVLKVPDVAVLPSVWNEGAGLAMLEAMASGIPLITTATGGIPEYVEKGSACFVEWTKNFVDDLADAMLLLAENETLRKRLAAHAKENAKRFSAENYYQNYASLACSYFERGEEDS